jgi:small conductance mechanosensitive channel
MDLNNVKPTDISTDKINTALERLIELGVQYAPKLALAILSLVVGLFIIGKLTKAFNKVLNLRNLDKSLSDFLTSLVSWTLKILLFISVISMVGVTTTSFVALVGAAGLAVGVALQGTLSNFAGGVMIMLFKPFRAGDYIIAQGEEGTVRSIDVFATHLNKLDNRRVILPNGPLASGTIVNVTAEEMRQVRLPIGISYGDNIKTAIQALEKMCESHPKVLKDPAIMVVVTDYADSSINLSVRAWVKTEDFWDVYFNLNESIKPTLDQANITIPFPQRDVHVYEESKI